MSQEFTHKGWFGICPVYFADLDSDAPLIVERNAIYIPLFILSEFMFSIIHFVQSLINPDADLYWPLKVTGYVSKESH